MSAGITVTLYQPTPAWSQTLREAAGNSKALIGELFGEAWEDHAAETVFNATIQVQDGSEAHFSFELAQLDDEAALFKAVRSLPAGFSTAEVFYEAVGERRQKWHVAGKNASKKAFAEALLSQAPIEALRYALRSENLPLFKAALPPNGWGSIQMGEDSVLEYCWEHNLNAFADVLLEQLTADCGLDFSRPGLLAGAICHGSAERVAQLLRLGVDPLALDAEGNNALHLWAENNPDMDLLRLLLKSAVPVNARTPDGWTPVQLLVMAGADEIKSLLRLLQKAGADLQARCAKGGSLLWYADDKKLRAYLREQGVTFARPDDAYLEGNPLRTAMEHGDEEMFPHYLQPAWLNANERLLYTAYEQGRFDWFQALLAHGASPDEYPSGSTSLFEFLLGEREQKWVDELLAHGLDINGTPQQHNRYYPVYEAFRDQDHEQIRFFRDAGCDPSALLVILASARWPAVRAKLLFGELVAAGADVNRHYQQDWRLAFIPPGGGHATPLYTALQENDVMLVRLLLEHGADANFSAQAISAPLKYIGNLLSWAPPAKQADIQAIRELLVKHGAKDAAS